MSLLNDMLRDLSQQQKSTDPIAVVPQASVDLQAEEQRELFYNSSAAKPLPRTLLPSLVVFFLVLAILVFLKLKPATQQAADESVNASPIAEQAQAESKSVGLKGASEVERIIAAPAVSTPELGERIAALESAITQLSTVVANANIQPDSDEIVAATSELKNQNANADLQVVERELQAEHTPVDATEENLTSVSIQEPFVEPVEEHEMEQGEPALSIMPNAKWQDQQQAQQANQLIAQGQVDVAIEKLQQFIGSTAQPQESVKALLDIFAAQERIEAMQSLLLQADYLPLVERTFYTAKMAVIQQQDAQAIQLLEAHFREAGQHEAYRALLAGLYQRTGMNLEAANHYRRLLSVFGDKPAYWLGFALAQDALNQPQVAAQAYQRVNQYADLQPQVRTYVQQRIAALQQ